MDGRNSTQPAHSVNIVNGTYPQLITFLVLNVVPSHSALPLLVFLVLARRIQRHATFVNLMFVFIIVGVSSSILLYAGKHTGPEPSKTLCLFQASLLYGVPAISSMAALMLVLQMFLVIRETFYGRTYMERDHVFRSWLMVVAPYIAWLISVVVTAAVGSADPGNVSRNRRFFYCSVKSDPLTNTITTVAALILFATIALEVATVVLFYKRWVQVQQGTSSKAIELNLPIRILSFGLYLVIAMSMSLLSIKTPQSPAPDLIIASASMVVVLIFGTQRDVLRALCFWRARDHHVPLKDTESINSVVKG
ncbi:hypothetical protein L218DRAFT_1073564 [Marasmius fiardii PR-910]|nr:hypothetical protein L218DRAFT_1073564 [Marasmius fiardii PR-910]